MRAALSIVLAAFLIILPIEQVLAQAVQQQTVSVQQKAPDGAAALFRVPPLTEDAARLLRMNPVHASLPTTDPGLAVAPNPGVDEVAPVPLSRGTAVAVGFLVVIVSLVVVAFRARSNCLALLDTC